MTRDELRELIELHDPPNDYSVWPLIVEFVAEWIGNNVVDESFGWDKDVPPDCGSYSQQWREEMGES